MDQNKKPSKFGLGFLIGSVLGGLTGLFLAPKTGEQMRKEAVKKIIQLKKVLKQKELDKKIKEIFGEVSQEGKSVLERIKKEIINHLNQLKEKIDKIDKEKYLKTIDEVFKKVQKETKKEIKHLEKIKKHLLDKWEETKT